MTFRETLDKARKEAIDIGVAYVAQEVADYECAETILDPDLFEGICVKVHSIWLNYSYSVRDIVDVIMKLLFKENIPFDELSDEKVLKSL